MMKGTAQENEQKVEVREKKRQEPSDKEQEASNGTENKRKRQKSTMSMAKAGIKLKRYSSSFTNLASLDKDPDKLSEHDFTEVPSQVVKLNHGTKSQVKLMWTQRPRNCFLVKKIHNTQASVQMRTMIKWLTTQGVCVYVEASAAEEFPDQKVLSKENQPLIDFCISLGGDGTLLHLNSHFQNPPACPPTIAFAAGTLGFLTPFKFERFQRHLEPIVRGGVPLYCSLRMRLNVRVIRANGQVYPDVPYQVLNEVLLDRGRELYLTDVLLTVDGHETTKIQADGVIVSTPTGSTAYSMSAGGSMVAPTVSAILLTPICPHTLSFRPLILPDSSVIELSIPQDSKRSAWASFDGRNQTQLFPGDRVEIKFSEWPVPSLNMSSFNTEWLHSIKNKLNWNQRHRDLPSPMHGSAYAHSPALTPKSAAGGRGEGTSLFSSLPPAAAPERPIASRGSLLMSTSNL